MTVFNRRNTEGQAAPAVLVTVLAIVDVVALAWALKAALGAFA